MLETQSQGQIQEHQYDFPYHHIPQWGEDRFHQARQLDWGFEYASYVSFILDKLDEIPFLRAVDVGCGDGRFLSELSARQPGKEYVGIDTSKRAVLLARALVPQVRWIHGSISETEELPGPADVVTLIETLEHIPPDVIPGFLTGIDRALTSSGRLLVSVPSKNLPLQDKHFQHFDEASLRAVLLPHFEIEELYWVNRSVKYLSRVYRRLLSNSIFILNHQGLLARLYRIYLNRLFQASATNGMRLVAVCRKTGPTFVA